MTRREPRHAFLSRGWQDAMTPVLRGPRSCPVGAFLDFVPCVVSFVPVISGTSLINAALMEEWISK